MNKVVPEKQKRPKRVQSSTERIETGCGHMYVTVGKNDDGVIIEVFGILGKAGGCAMAQNEALTRSISLGLKRGIPVEDYIEELENIRCASPINDGRKVILSCADAIVFAMGRELGYKKLEESGNE